MSDKLTNEQLQFLQEFKEKQFDISKEIHSDIFPAIMEGIRQIRELTLNIAIIAGAISAFTIPIIRDPTVHNKLFAYISLALLFSVIVYAIYHLSEVIPLELNELGKQHSTYLKLMNENIDRTNKAMTTGNPEELLKFDEQEIRSQLNDLKVENKPDKSLNNLRILLTAALILLLLSFIPFRIAVCGTSC